jgi:hypothetical protein
MAATFGAAVSATAPAIVDINVSQSTGAVCAGIGLIPADEASIGASRIGGEPGTDLVGETGDGVGV